VQYVGRLLLRALRDELGTAGDLTLATIKDRHPIRELDEVQSRVFAGGGNRVRTGWNILRLLRRESWDLIVLGHLSLASLLLTVRQTSRPPVLGLIHGLEAWQPLRGLRRRGLLCVDRLLFTTHYSQGRSQEANPWLTRLDQAICPLGLLPDEDGPAIGAVPISDPFALVIGRMSANERYKGHEELIRVWPAVQQVRPQLHLVLLGEGNDRPRLEALARGVGAGVHFLGRTSDATRNACLAACRCFCLPSRGEGFGLVYLEAMRAGKPVLASSCDAGGEVIANGVTGRAVNPTNPDELLQGVLDVSGERAEEMGRAGQARFQELFAYERFLKRFSEQVRAIGCLAGRARARTAPAHSVP
jgi:phosphatidylinositol alpha-1,6-mannosyltransferase